MNLRRSIKRCIKKAFRRGGLQISSAPSERFEKCWPMPKAATVSEFEREDEFHALYEEAQEATQMTSSDNPMRRQRHFVLRNVLSNVGSGLGEVAECGCWRGLSSYQIASDLDGWEEPVFHIFDSFAGLSEFRELDGELHSRSEEERAARREEFSCDLDVVKSNLSCFPFIQYYKGWIPDRFREVADRSFAFVHIDVDMYQPTKDSFLFFFPRLVSGGAMVFDDYGFPGFPGARRAVDECLDKIPSHTYFFVPTPCGSAFLIKM